MEQLEWRGALHVFALGKFQANPGQHAQKSAVHGQTIAQFKNKTVVTPMPEFINQILEIEAGSEIRPSVNLDADCLVKDRHH
jgi:hypothetical protein